MADEIRLTPEQEGDLDDVWAAIHARKRDEAQAAPAQAAPPPAAPPQTPTPPPAGAKR